MRSALLPSTRTYEHSFAGQFHTALGASGRTQFARVSRPAASAEAARVEAYAAARPGADTRVAVVVQRMVDAAHAGVLFTADPVSGRRDRWVVEIGRARGGAVSGEAQGRRTVYDSGVVEEKGLHQEDALLDGARRLAADSMPRRRGVRDRPGCAVVPPGPTGHRAA